MSVSDNNYKKDLSHGWTFVKLMGIMKNKLIQRK